jgi:L-fuculose-phosphate aldolase
MTDQMRAAVASASRRLALEGLLIGTSGNVSIRDGDRVAVTPSGLDLADCRLEHVTVVSLSGRVLAGKLAPTSELDLHLGVYADTGARAVVHTHAPYATALACVLDELPVIHYQQLILGGSIRVAPYAVFGTPELATFVRTALVDRQAALMGSHGSVAIGPTLEQAVDHALLLEWIATLYHRASVLGTPAVLSEQQQLDVITAALARGYGSPQENP